MSLFRRKPPMRRRSDWLAQSDDPLHRLAAELVDRALAQRFRAMVATAAVVALIVTLAVALPLTLIQNSQTDKAARTNARHNCDLITTVAQVLGSGNPHNPRLRAGGLISSDAELRATEAKRTATIRGKGPLAQVLNDPQTLMLERQNVVTERVTLAYWRHNLIPALLDAAHTDCGH